MSSGVKSKPEAGQPVHNFADSRIETAFPSLSCAQVSALVPFGKRHSIPKGGSVWAAGESQVCMFVVIEGAMDVLDGRTGSFVASHVQGEFSGDIDVLSGRPTLVSAVASSDLDVLVVPGDCVRSIVSELPEIGDIILRAFLMRRALLQEMTTIGPLVVGSRFSADTLRIREFLARNRSPHVWEDLEANPATSQILQEFHVTEDQTPVVILPSGKLLRVPTNRDLGEALGLSYRIDTEIFDLVVIGAGPAGLAAAVYGATEGLKTIVLDADGPGGQAGMSSRIENYMGFPTGLSGQDLADRATVQAERFGARMIVPGCVRNITCNDLGGHALEVDGLGTIESKCVILATGAAYRKLGIDGLERFEGRGIYYAATNVERILCGSSDVVVVGGGNSAGQAAVFLSEGTRHVYLVVRGDDLRKMMSSYLALRIERSPNISLVFGSEVTDIAGEGAIESASITNRRSGQTETHAVSAVFVMIGAEPRTDWLPDSIQKDAKGFIKTGQQLVQDGEWRFDRTPFFLETSCPGVFAAGDARSNSVKRVASAVGEGSMAVALVHEFLAL